MDCKSNLVEIFILRRLAEEWQKLLHCQRLLSAPLRGLPTLHLFTPMQDRVRLMCPAIKNSESWHAQDTLNMLRLHMTT